MQFNARSESVAEKPAFRRLLPCKRCLVLVDGFYEWKKVGYMEDHMDNKRTG